MLNQADFYVRICFLCKIGPTNRYCTYMYPVDYASQYLIRSNLYYKLDFLFPKRPKKVDELFKHFPVRTTIISQSTQTALCALRVFNNAPKCVLARRKLQQRHESVIRILDKSYNYVLSFRREETMNTGVNHTPCLNHFKTFHSRFIQTGNPKTLTPGPQTRPWRIVLAIIGAKKHHFLNDHCHGIISKFQHFLEHKFIKFSKYGVFSTEIN